MGRIKIKKKNAVLPFRETVAYRFLILAAAGAVFVISLFVLISSLTSGSAAALIASGLLALATGILAIYNLTRMRTAKIPRSALQRMKRR